MKNIYKNKKVLVYGLSSSGVWVTKLLNKLKCDIYLYDDNLEKANSIGIKKCKVLQLVDEATILSLDFIIVSPSIEKDNFVIVKAIENNIKVFSELEFSAQFCKNILAVTGTNGKTTTVSLISSIINTEKKAIACGNIGYPLSKAVLLNKKYVKVVEVSSFMLEHAKTFSPNVATVLNIAPDHLIRHKTMEEYSNLKMSIFSNMNAQNYAVVNLDDNLIIKQNTKKITYSYTKNADVRYKDGSIYLFNKRLIDINQIPLKGKHNIYNVMCSICFAYIMGIKPVNMVNAIAAFKSDKFRNELVATVNNVKFINDSKSTNIASTLASTNSVKGAIILLLCGSNKDLNYTELFSNLTKRVKEIVVFGEISNSVISSATENFKIVKCENLNQAFDYAVSIAKPNDTVLLSPSSASYDQFTSYVERGQKFNEKVKAYELQAKKK